MGASAIDRTAADEPDRDRTDRGNEERTAAPHSAHLARTPITAAAPRTGQRAADERRAGEQRDADRHRREAGEQEEEFRDDGGDQFQDDVEDELEYVVEHGFEGVFGRLSTGESTRWFGLGTRR